MSKDKKDNNFIKIFCEETYGIISFTVLIILLTITVLSAFVTISVFLYTVKKAKETVEKRRRSSIISSEEDSSEEPIIHLDEDQINKIAHSETCIGSSINVENTNTLPCSVVVPGVEVVGRDVSEVGDVTTVGSISVVESDEIEVVSV